MKKMPTRTSKCLRRTRACGVTSAPGRGSWSSRCCEADEELVLDARRVLGLLGQLELRGRHACRVPGRPGRGRAERQPEQQPERSDQREVVDGNTRRARDPVLLASRSTPGRIAAAMMKREEEQRDHELQLPERERDRDHGDRDHGRDEGTAGGIAHLQAFSPCKEQCKHRWQDRSAARRSKRVDARQRARGGLLRRPPARRGPRATARAGGRHGQRGRDPARAAVSAADSGAVLLAVAAGVLLRAVWRWERAHLVVTTEKLFVVDGTLRRRSSAVRLRSLENLDLEQSLPGRLLGYGTLVAGPLQIEHVPHARSVYRLVEQLAG